MRDEQTYLGDGVYASFDGFHVVLTVYAEGPIYLDRSVFQSPVDYGNSVFEQETLYGNCSVCGEPISDDDEPHTDFDGYDCHAECCPVCHEGEPPYEDVGDPLERWYAGIKSPVDNPLGPLTRWGNK